MRFEMVIFVAQKKYVNVNERLIVTYEDNGTVNLDNVRLFIRSKSFQKVKPDGDKDEAAGRPMPDQKPRGQG